MTWKLYDKCSGIIVNERADADTEPFLAGRMRDIRIEQARLCLQTMDDCLWDSFPLA